MHPSKVEITEVGTRDGLQSEVIFVPTDAKIALIRSFAAAGLRRIEATSFVSPRAVPQLSDASLVVAAVRDLDATIVALVPNAKGAARAVADLRESHISSHLPTLPESVELD
jgi:hydroxymethylglutaryl-CoA lyase